MFFHLKTCCQGYEQNSIDQKFVQCTSLHFAILNCPVLQCSEYTALPFTAVNCTALHGIGPKAIPIFWRWAEKYAGDVGPGDLHSACRSQAVPDDLPESHWMEELMFIPCKRFDVTHRDGISDRRLGCQPCNLFPVHQIYGHLRQFFKKNKREQSSR